MHGIEQVIRNFRTPSLPAPRLPDFPATGSMPTDAPRIHFERGCPLATAFLSPAMIFRSRRFPFTGSKFPACCLVSEPIGFLRPVRLGAPQPNLPVCPVLATSTRQTRCGLAARLPKLRFQLPLPFGTLTSLGIDAFHWLRRSATRLPGPARSPVAPRNLFYY